MRATIIIKQDEYDPRTESSDLKTYILHMVGGFSDIEISPEVIESFKFLKVGVSLPEMKDIIDQCINVIIRDSWLKSFTIEDLDEVIHELIMLREQRLAELMDQGD